MVDVNDYDKEMRMHNDALSAFNTELYADIFTDENVRGKKKAIIIGEEKFYGYFLEKGKNTYFASDTYIEHLPFKVLKKQERDYKGEVFNLDINNTHTYIAEDIAVHNCGAGGGGFLLLYTPKEKQEGIIKALPELRHVPFSFEPEGSKIIYFGD